MPAGVPVVRPRPRALALWVIAVGASAVWPLYAQPPLPERQQLTDQETAARLEKAGKEPLALLELAPLVGNREAQRIRQQVKDLLADRKQIAGREELDRLTRAVARALPAAARTPEEIRAVLGPPRQVLRQVFYRRYLEQWHYDTPLTLCVVLEGAKGQQTRVQTVLVSGVEKP